jgi:hypothetical protein
MTVKIRATITSVSLSGDSLTVEASGPQVGVSEYYPQSVITFTVADRARPGRVLHVGRELTITIEPRKP